MRYHNWGWICEDGQLVHRERQEVETYISDFFLQVLEEGAVYLRIVSNAADDLFFFLFFLRMA